MWKIAFMTKLYSTLWMTLQSDKIILLGDFNARVGRNHDIWKDVIGHHNVGNINSSGLRLHSLCSELVLAIKNTFFQLCDMYKISWMHLRSKHWHLIDYINVARCDLNEVQITRAMRGAECSTPHHLTRSTLRLTVWPPARKQKPIGRLNVRAAHSQNIREELRSAIAQSFCRVTQTTTSKCTSNLITEWQAHSSALLDASKSTHSNLERRHQDWYHDSETDCSLIHNKNTAHDALLRNKQGPSQRLRLNRWPANIADHSKTWWPTIIWRSGKGRSQSQMQQSSRSWRHPCWSQPPWWVCITSETA